MSYGERVDAEKKLLRTVDVAAICRVSPASVRRWVAEGKIVAFRTPGAGRLLIDPDTLIAIMHHGARSNEGLGR